ncbi:MAG TPA: 30S ribosomal protein S2, partial [Gaiellaceae bacterium]|nr:30S ribosomal protein S2 [Gaiellaceae bacterium]
TNCDPDEADYIVPGNDDAIRSCSLIVRAIADGIAAGQTRVTEREFESNGNGGAPAAEGEAATPASDPAQLDETPAEHEPLAQAEATVEPTAPSEVTGEAAAAEPAAIVEELAEGGQADAADEAAADTTTEEGGTR